MALEKRSENKIVFKKAKYCFVEDIVLPLAETYVPDWDLEKAIKESLQNAYDETWISGQKAYTLEEDDGIYLRDTGRGVHWSKILVIGETGKRNEIDVVGTHGEGEIISFLVSARDGIRKRMASQDWLLEGRIGENEHGQRVLILARYRTASGTKRKGTRWTYTEDGTYACTVKRGLERAKDAFSNHAAVVKHPKRVFCDYGSRGSLLTNGQRVMQDWHLSLGYNLLLHPGRDRSTFSLSDPKVLAEIKTILENDASEQDFAVILRESIYGASKVEFDLDLPDLDPNIVKKAVKLLEKDGIVLAWATNGEDSAQIADAVESAKCKVLVFDRAPIWLQRGLPHVSAFVKSYAKEGTKKRMPRDFQQAVYFLLHDVYRIMDVTVEMHNPLSESIIADANSTARLIRFDWKKSKSLSIVNLFETLGHELAHIVSDAEDCTRAHTNAMGMLMGRAARTLAEEKDASNAWRKAAIRIQRYTRRKGD